MFHLGDEFTLESYRIPWLIWIQLIVLFLLLLLLFCFSLSPLDPADDFTAATATPATASASTNCSHFHDIRQIQNEKPPAVKHDLVATAVTSRGSHKQEREIASITSEIATCGSMKREEVTEGEASSLFLHPCHCFQLAIVAFLKCFGLDSASDGTSTPRHRKRK